MLSLTKKSDTQPLAAQLWHTNFRNYERLPDTKVVRTNFFIITVAVAIALGLLLWLGHREYHIYSLGEQIAEAQKVIQSNKKQNAEALRLEKIFTAEQKKLADADAFRNVPITPSEFIKLLGQNLPKEIAVDFIDIRMSNGGGTFNMKGSVTGTPDQASGTANSYVDSLRADPRWSSIFEQITLTSIIRDTRSGFLLFDISCKLKAKK